MKKLILALMVLSMSSVSARATPSVVLRASTLCLPSTLQVEGDTAGALSYTWYFFSWTDAAWHVDPDIQGPTHTFTTLPVYSRSYMVTVQTSSGLYQTNKQTVCKCTTLSQPLRIISGGASSKGYPVLSLSIPEGYEAVTLEINDGSGWKTTSYTGTSSVYLGTQKVYKIQKYRLRGVDPTGHFVYSNIWTIRPEGNNIFQYPVTLRVFTMLGQKVAEYKNVSVVGQDHAFLFATQSLRPGTYSIQVIGVNEEIVLKKIVQ